MHGFIYLNMLDKVGSFFQDTLISPSFIDIFMASYTHLYSNMKTKKLIALVCSGLFLALNFQSLAQSSSVEPFLGMWALTLDYEEENAGWLEVRQEERRRSALLRIAARHE